MKTLFRKWLREDRTRLNNKDHGQISASFSKWLSGLGDDANRRFRSVYRVNKFMIRKWLENGVAQNL